MQALGSHIEIVVIGGSALTALGLVKRATRDVDLLAIVDNGELRLAEPLPQPLLTARSAVAADFGLTEDWLNAGPTNLLKWGLPEGFMSRVVTRPYGTALVVHFASRLDQIHFKLFATVDQGGGASRGRSPDAQPDSRGTGRGGALVDYAGSIAWIQVGLGGRCAFWG